MFFKFNFWPQYLILEHHKSHLHIVRVISHTFSSEEAIIITEVTQTRTTDVIVELDDLRRYFDIESAIWTEENQGNCACIPDPDILCSGIGHL